MSDPHTTTQPGPEPGPTADWRDLRRAERHARREGRRQAMAERMGRHWHGVPVGGIVVLAIGVVLLMGNFGFHLPPRWWAALILIPAVAALVSAIRFYRIDGGGSARVTASAIGGLVLLALALALFFGVNWGLFWPVILILVGIGMVSRSYWR